MITVRSILALIISTLMIGCAGIPQPVKIYDESQVPVVDAVLLEGYVGEKFNIFNAEIVVFRCVDGRDLDAYWVTYQKSHSRWADSVLVRPGFHSLNTLYSGALGTSNVDIWFEAKADSKYQMKREVITAGAGAARSNSVRVWVEDVATGANVSGRRGEEPAGIEPLKYCGKD